MPKKHRRYFLKERNVKKLIKHVLKKFQLDLKQFFPGKIDIELVEIKAGTIYLVNQKPLFLQFRQKIVPALLFNEFFVSAAKVVIDMGAVPSVCRGADIMAPGVVRIEGECKKGDIVFVVDEKHHKPLALGEMMFDSNKTEGIQRGVVTKNIHYVGDKMWNAIKELGFQ